MLLLFFTALPQHTYLSWSFLVCLCGLLSLQFKRQKKSGRYSSSGLTVCNSLPLSRWIVSTFKALKSGLMTHLSWSSILLHSPLISSFLSMQFLLLAMISSICWSYYCFLHSISRTAHWACIHMGKCNLQIILLLLLFVFCFVLFTL